MTAVLHCAGPFAHTSRPMADACLRVGTHYLDITGEAAVFEALAARSAEARAAGVMLLPGTGFDVVPSDCLAAHLKRRLPSATRLALGFQSLGRLSRGTATTMAENVHRGGLVREGGVLRRVPTAWKVRAIDFGCGPVKAITIPWGDVSTAYHSTGIPNIEVYMAAPLGRRLAARASRYLGWLLGSRAVQAIPQAADSRRPAGTDGGGSGARLEPAVGGGRGRRRAACGVAPARAGGLHHDRSRGAGGGRPGTRGRGAAGLPDAVHRLRPGPGPRPGGRDPQRRLAPWRRAARLSLLISDRFIPKCTSRHPCFSYSADVQIGQNPCACGSIRNIVPVAPMWP